MSETEEQKEVQAAADNKVVQLITEDELKYLLEAALFSAETALTVEQLLQGVLSQYALNRPRVRQALDALEQDYKHRGVQLVQVASGYRFQTRADLGPQLALMWPERVPRYSSALLETLALIAWRQPATRGDVEAVRGVAVSTQMMRTLLERGWVKVVGHKEVPGRPTLYGTTQAFLDYFSLQSLADLSSLVDLEEKLTDAKDQALTFETKQTELKLEDMNTESKVNPAKAEEQE